ncbi:MAG: hypothetical protein LBI20_01005 [Holosporales bacterium]|jgi:hypothetical protein|nr:hypothetical protein [Holosporales bacterium]
MKSLYDTMIGATASPGKEVKIEGVKRVSERLGRVVRVVEVLARRLGYLPSITCPQAEMEEEELRRQRERWESNEVTTDYLLTNANRVITNLGALVTPEGNEAWERLVREEGVREVARTVELHLQRAMLLELQVYRFLYDDGRVVRGKEPQEISDILSEYRQWFAYIQGILDLVHGWEWQVGLRAQGMPFLLPIDYKRIRGGCEWTKRMAEKVRELVLLPSAEGSRGG